MKIHSTHVLLCQPGASKYADKVDIWASGIILFEMLNTFQTGMERIDAILNLRKHCQFPSGFEALYPEASEVMKWCCAVNPQDRPSASELLNSSLVVSKIDADREFLKASLAITTNPRSRSYPLLVDALFQAPAPSGVAAGFLVESKYAPSEPVSLPHWRMLSAINEALAHIFRVHCSAADYLTPTLRPKSGLFDCGALAAAALSHPAELIDPSGQVRLFYQGILFGRFLSFGWTTGCVIHEALCLHATVAPL